MEASFSEEHIASISNEEMCQVEIVSGYAKEGELLVRGRQEWPIRDVNRIHGCPVPTVSAVSACLLFVTSLFSLAGAVNLLTV
jgi:hypothetical protein